ncbi:MAG: hypothetical protein HZB46_03110 [Solirubrobacterales bacterium]|nr:hypothetical protein [Solirubrobacterales bacterium]
MLSKQPSRRVVALPLSMPSTPAKPAGTEPRATPKGAPAPPPGRIAVG